MLRRYADQIFDIFNYVDSVIITDENAVIQYYYSNREGAQCESDVLGKYILDAYPTLDRDSSTILRVLRTGEPVLNEVQVLRDVWGHHATATTTTLPIMEGEQIVGAADVSSYQREGIVLSRKEMKEEKGLYRLDDIISVSDSMSLLKGKIEKVAATDSSIMIYGETGTGKELIAQSIHTESGRRKKPFVSQNCAAIPSTLLEGILFGTEKGSFTGAETRPGLFERANGGTLFLDEINSMELSVQPKILKAIEEKQVVRVGGYQPIAVDVKIVSAVNEDPLRCVHKGKMREDLFYRLSVVQLTLPPLRERMEDLEPLVNYFIRSYNEKMNKDIMGLEKEVEEIFRGYSWPGNVRELRNIVENAFNMASSRFIQTKDLPEYLLRSGAKERFGFGTGGGGVCAAGGLGAGGSASGRRGTLAQILEEIEEEIIRETLAVSATYLEAAQKLGLSKQAFDYKLKKYKLKQY